MGDCDEPTFTRVFEWMAIDSRVHYLKSRFPISADMVKAVRNLAGVADVIVLTPDSFAVVYVGSWNLSQCKAAIERILSGGNPATSEVDRLKAEVKRVRLERDDVAHQAVRRFAENFVWLSNRDGCTPDMSWSVLHPNGNRYYHPTFDDAVNDLIKVVNHKP